MKYKIPQERLYKLVFRYLDMQYGDLEKEKGKYIDIVFKKQNSDSEYGVMGWKKPDNIFIYFKIINEISDMFSMEYNDSAKVIGRWAEDRYKLKVNNTHSSNRLVRDALKIDIN